MQCFNHEGIPAIGLCKCCHKGLCHDCVTDLGDGLACKGVHEEQVQATNRVIEKNVKMYQSASTNTLIGPVFYGFMGVIFLYFGLQMNSGLTSLSSIMGAGFLIFGVTCFVRNRAIFKDSDTVE